MATAFRDMGNYSIRAVEPVRFGLRWVICNVRM